jgi:hypothetical protein
MSFWITTVVVPFAIFIATIAAQFYFKWVPSVEDQKRHVRRLLAILAEVGVFAWGGLALYKAAHQPGPVTYGNAVQIALLTAGLYTLLILIAIAPIPRVIASIADLIGRHIRTTEQTYAVLDRHREVFEDNCARPIPFRGFCSCHPRVPGLEEVGRALHHGSALIRVLRRHRLSGSADVGNVMALSARAVGHSCANGILTATLQQ